MSVTTRLQNSQRARILSRAATAAITVARAPRGSRLGYFRAMSHATMDAQELLPRKSLHKSSHWCPVKSVLIHVKSNTGTAEKPVLYGVDLKLDFSFLCRFPGSAPPENAP